MNSYNHYTGNPNSFEMDLGRVRGATSERVLEWARSVLKERDRIVALVTTSKQAPIAGRVTNVKRSARGSK